MVGYEAGPRDFFDQPRMAVPVAGDDKTGPVLTTDALKQAADRTRAPANRMRASMRLWQLAARSTIMMWLPATVC